MYLTGLHGQGTSARPGGSGAPTEWTARTKKPFPPSWSSTAVPVRVMTCIEAATYAESVISTPSWEIGEPIGPMQNGTTYMTRPAMQPANSSARVACICAGAIQLLVGPASSCCSEQMNVRSSTRATSEGSDDAAKLPGRSSGLSRVSVPRSTSRPLRSCHSRCEPSHQWTAAGRVSAAICATHAISPPCRVGARPSPGISSATLSPSRCCPSGRGDASATAGSGLWQAAAAGITGRRRRGRLTCRPGDTCPLPAGAADTLMAASATLSRARGPARPRDLTELLSLQLTNLATQARPATGRGRCGGSRCRDRAPLACVRAARCQGPSSSPSRRASGAGGPATSMTLSRLVAPVTSVTARRGTLNASATARRTVWVAATPAGRPVTQTTRASRWRPPTAVRAAPGRTRTATRTAAR